MMSAARRCGTLHAKGFETSATGGNTMRKRKAPLLDETDVEALVAAVIRFHENDSTELSATEVII